MKSLKFMLIIYLLMSLCGCVVAFRNIDREILEGISLGMSREEVRQIAGEPASVKNMVIDGKEYEVWSYPIEEKLAGKYNALGHPYYEILFLEGKVRSWHKTRLYSQPKYELGNFEAPESAKTFRFFDRQ